MLKPSLTLSIDDAKMDKDALLDGCYLIASSDLALSAQEFIEKYRGRWQIEKSFRMIKRELEERPIFLSTDEHTIESLQEGLREMNAIALESGVYKIMKYNEIQRDIQDKLGVVIGNSDIRKETLNKNSEI